MGFDVSVRPGWTPVWDCWVSPDPAETFSSSLLLRQAALGFKLRSAHPKHKSNIFFPSLSLHFFERFNLDMTQPGTNKWHLKHTMLQPHLWLAAPGWVWRPQPDGGLAVLSVASRSSGAAGTCDPAPWRPRWCLAPSSAPGHCWPSSSHAHARLSALDSDPHLRWCCCGDHFIGYLVHWLVEFESHPRAAQHEGTF